MWANAGGGAIGLRAGAASRALGLDDALRRGSDGGARRSAGRLATGNRQDQRSRLRCRLRTNPIPVRPRAALPLVTAQPAACRGLLLESRVLEHAQRHMQAAAGDQHGGRRQRCSLRSRDGFSDCAQSIAALSTARLPLGRRRGGGLRRAPRGGDEIRLVALARRSTGGLAKPTAASDAAMRSAADGMARGPAAEPGSSG